MLITDALNVFYDEVQALTDVSIEVHQGELLVIIGSNGAGKTTLLKTLSGLIRPREGRIYWDKKPIEKASTEQICRLGIIHVPEGRRLFPQMTVAENLEMGSFLSESRTKVEETCREVFQLFPVLKDRKKQLAGTLSGGEQQMLAIARALMAQPKLLMLDEPSLGLSPKIGSEIYSILHSLHLGRMTVLLVSQDVMQALRIADRVYVIENGRIVLEGPGAELLRDPRVKEAYLGL